MTFDRPATHTVNGLIRAALDADPDAPFLDFSGEMYSYGRVAAETDRLARGLHALGVSRGDRVVTVLDNGPDAVIASLRRKLEDLAPAIETVRGYGYTYRAVSDL